MRSKSSRNWLKEHFSDVYVKRAKHAGLRSRSVYKLLEIQERYKIIRPNMLVVDLGAAPGGWSEYVSGLVGNNGKIFAVDLLPMQPIAGVEFVQGDFTQDSVVNSLGARLGRKVDVVLSDLAPNFSGVDVVDQAQMMHLGEKAMVLVQQVLKVGGVFLLKIFQGEGFEGFLQSLRHSFSKVKVMKPEASRSRSSEVYLLAKNFKGK